jgi:hypothetical protein
MPAAAQEQPDVVDAMLSDTFVTLLLRVDVLGPCARLTFGVPCRSFGYRGGEERVEHHVIERLVMPIEAARAMAEKVIAGLTPQDNSEPLMLLEPVGTC